MRDAAAGKAGRTHRARRKGANQVYLVGSNGIERILMAQPSAAGGATRKLSKRLRKTASVVSEAWRCSRNLGAPRAKKTARRKAQHFSAQQHAYLAHGGVPTALTREIGE